MMSIYGLGKLRTLMGSYLKGTCDAWGFEDAVRIRQRMKWGGNVATLMVFKPQPIDVIFKVGFSL